jgi:hypothetical protein
VEQKAIFISMSEEVEALLADNGIDLIDELARTERIDITRGQAPDPTSVAKDQTKDISLVILASAAAFTAISVGIAKIIDALGRNRKVIVKERECVPLTDQGGKVVYDKDGQPIMHWITKTKMLEAMQATQDKSKVDFSYGGEYGLRVELGSGQEN